MNRKTGTNFIIVILFVIIGSFSLSAQNQMIQKGDRYFENEEYAHAINYYEKFLENSTDPSIQRKLAKCYIQTHNDSKAIYLLEKLVKNNKSKAKDYLQYANVLKRMGNYSEAKIWYQKYAEINPADKNITDLIRSCNLIHELEDKHQYNIEAIDINSPQSDFSSAIYKNGLVFVSGRPNETSKKVDGRSGEHYLDLYYTEKVGNRFIEPIPFSKTFNSKYHEGPACFTPNERFIYFTRNKGNLNLEGKSELNIYTARFNGESWDKPELFLFAGRAYSIGHPSISPDGRYLFFISNMKGGYGGTDIYLCRKLGFTWSKPINLGPNVNTEGNEMFPFFGDDNYLYFASDGHVGFGGLDIFKTTFTDNKWSYPVNLGPPFNSEKDDFAFIFKGSKEDGYFSSNRRGNDDIFYFEQNPEQMQRLNGRLVDLYSKKSIDNAQIVLMDKFSKEKTVRTNEKGLFQIDIFKDKNYSLVISKRGYQTKRILYFANQNRKSRQLNISMETTPWSQLEGNIVDENTAQPIEGANLEIVNKIYKINQFCSTDEYGDFKIDIDPSKRYDIFIRCDGYFTKEIRNYHYQAEHIEQISLQKFSRNENMELFGVEFARSSSALTEQTKKELDNLTGLLLVNPNIAIEIIGFTNFDNGKKDNKILGLERASEAAKYVISRGITSNRIQFKSGGFAPGKSALAVKLNEAF